MKSGRWFKTRLWGLFAKDSRVAAHFRPPPKPTA